MGRDIVTTHKDKNSAERDRKFFVALQQYDSWWEAHIFLRHIDDLKLRLVWRFGW
jgi:hypothetical protein